MIQLLSALLPKALDIIDDVVPDKDAAAKAKQDIEKKLIDAANATNLAQIEVNKEEARSGNWFAQTWRPAIGWSCALGIFWLFIGQPFAQWIINLAGVDTVVPTVPSDMLLELTFALLGMAGLRTFEKLKGITK